MEHEGREHGGDESVAPQGHLLYSQQSCLQGLDDRMEPEGIAIAGAVAIAMGQGGIGTNRCVCWYFSTDGWQEDLLQLVLVVGMKVGARLVAQGIDEVNSECSFC